MLTVLAFDSSEAAANCSRAEGRRPGPGEPDAGSATASQSRRRWPASFRHRRVPGHDAQPVPPTASRDLRLWLAPGQKYIVAWW